MKTDPRVKTRTQREADKALSDMFQANRGLKPKWVPKPASVKIKKKKRKVKVKVSVDIETAKFFGMILLSLCSIGLMFYSYHANFVAKPEVRVMPELQ